MASATTEMDIITVVMKMRETACLNREAVLAAEEAAIGTMTMIPVAALIREICGLQHTALPDPPMERPVVVRKSLCNNRLLFFYIKSV